jgi:hypothetical protein
MEQQTIGSDRKASPCEFSAGERAVEFYQIRVQGQVDRRWFASQDDLSITWTDEGDTLLYATVADQAALHGLLAQIRDLGVTLVSIHRIEPGGE